MSLIWGAEKLLKRVSNNCELEASKLTNELNNVDGACERSLESPELYCLSLWRYEYTEIGDSPSSESTENRKTTRIEVRVYMTMTTLSIVLHPLAQPSILQAEMWWLQK